MKQQFTVTALDAGARVDRFLADKLQLSRARLKALFEEGRIRVDGRRVSKSAIVNADARVDIDLPDEAASVLPEPDLPLAVLYEDDAILALDKPAGMPVHPLTSDERGTLANALIARFPECAQASADAPLECGIAHRLDHDTSGVLLVARTSEAYSALRGLFAKREIDKRYTALVGGLIADSGVVHLPIAHHPSDARRMVACADEEKQRSLKAREATTRYAVQRWLGDFALVDVDIPTGARHQIRVHLAAIGAPIVGDALYGGEALDSLGRHFLHARRVGLRHPLSGRRLDIESPLPDDLARVLEHLSVPQC